MKILRKAKANADRVFHYWNRALTSSILLVQKYQMKFRTLLYRDGGIQSERGDVPGWVLVVLMTTGLVTAIWTIAAPRLTAILRNSLDSMNGIR